jgi:hypothetical protein
MQAYQPAKHAPDSKQKSDGSEYAPARAREPRLERCARDDELDCVKAENGRKIPRHVTHVDRTIVKLRSWRVAVPVHECGSDCEGEKDAHND